MQQTAGQAHQEELTHTVEEHRKAVGGGIAADVIDNDLHKAIDRTGSKVVQRAADEENHIGAAAQQLPKAGPQGLLLQISTDFRVTFRMEKGKFIGIRQWEGQQNGKAQRPHVQPKEEIDPQRGNKVARDQGRGGIKDRTCAANIAVINGAIPQGHLVGPGIKNTGSTVIQRRDQAEGEHRPKKSTAKTEGQQRCDDHPTRYQYNEQPFWGNRTVNQPAVNRAGDHHNQVLQHSDVTTLYLGVAIIQQDGDRIGVQRTKADEISALQQEHMAAPAHAAFPPCHLL